VPSLSSIFSSPFLITASKTVQEQAVLSDFQSFCSGCLRLSTTVVLQCLRGLQNGSYRLSLEWVFPPADHSCSKMRLYDRGSRCTLREICHTVGEVDTKMLLAYLNAVFTMCVPWKPEILHYQVFCGICRLIGNSFSKNLHANNFSKLIYTQVHSNIPKWTLFLWS
jgi:hypothetical protein